LRAQLQPSGRYHRRARTLAAASIAALVSGCWTPPSADVRPGGEARVIAGGIEVERVADPATVESIGRAARTVALRVRGLPLLSCAVAPGVRNWSDLRDGDRVRATLRERLTVYVAPASGGASPDARVLAADPSYRLLTIEYPNGGTETFKVGLQTPMEEMEAGDSVAIRCVAAVALRVWRRPHRGQRSRSGQGAVPDG
jgi:hypothetical protein